MESISVDFSPEDIGGLANLKAWLRQRRDGFSVRAREFGLEPPPGVLMLGVQGCGKSLCAKAVAADWKMPLLRLDPGVLYQKFMAKLRAGSASWMQDDRHPIRDCSRDLRARGSAAFRDRF